MTVTKWNYNVNFPSVDDLVAKARRKIPKFAFEYLDGGCNEDVNRDKNTSRLREVELVPHYLSNYTGASLRTELFGHVYDAPFGIAPVGLQGLIWPNSPVILAKAALRHNIPFILSTVSTSGIEKISEVTEGKAWYQLYHPADDEIRDDLLERLRVAGYSVLVLLCDVPSFGFRPRDIRNGLAMPPRMTLNNIIQILGCPQWAIQTLVHGTPRFETMKKYMPKGLNMQQLGAYMDRTFSGRLNETRIASIRERWKGKIVLKGVADAHDASLAVKLGLDGIIVSNHGGRQLDAGQAAIDSLRLVSEYKDKIKIMMDSGLRSGPDVARTLAAGAEFTFLGRSFMYAVAALGESGGDHMVSVLKTQLKQVMDQIGCATIAEFPAHLVAEQTKPMKW